MENVIKRLSTEVYRELDDCDYDYPNFPEDEEYGIEKDEDIIIPISKAIDNVLYDLRKRMYNEWMPGVEPEDLPLSFEIPFDHAERLKARKENIVRAVLEKGRKLWEWGESLKTNK